MKLCIAVALSLCFAGCATAPNVGPKPNVAPVVQSNAATRASVKATRTNIKESQTHAAAGADALTNVASDLDQLLKK